MKNFRKTKSIEKVSSIFVASLILCLQASPVVAEDLGNLYGKYKGVVVSGVWRLCSLDIQSKGKEDVITIAVKNKSLSIEVVSGSFIEIEPSREGEERVLRGDQKDGDEVISSVFISLGANGSVRKVRIEESDNRSSTPRKVLVCGNLRYS